MLTPFPCPSQVQFTCATVYQKGKPMTTQFVSPEFVSEAHVDGVYISLWADAKICIANFPTINNQDFIAQKTWECWYTAEEIAQLLPGPASSGIFRALQDATSQADLLKLIPTL